MTITTALDLDWSLECTACGATRGPEGLPGVCACGEPWLVRYPARAQTIVDRTEIRRRGQANVDFAVGGSVKWLCGGPGNGWLYVRPDLAERLEPTFTGWQAHASPITIGR